MSNEPLSTTEQSKIVVAGLVGILSLLTLVGWIVLPILAFGIFGMRKSKDFAKMEVALKTVRIIFVVAITALLLFSGMLFLVGDYVSLGIFLLPIIAFVQRLIFIHLFQHPLESHREWVASNGVFATKAQGDLNASQSTAVDIFKGGPFNSNSVADELSKWILLKESGHVTEEEFQAARSKILGGRRVG